MARNQHHLGIDLSLAKASQRREPVHPWQPHVEDDQVDRPARHPLEARLAGRHRLDRVAFVAKHAAQRAANARLVVHDQDGGLHRDRFLLDITMSPQT